jgi:hypothetical protein
VRAGRRNSGGIGRGIVLTMETKTPDDMGPASDVAGDEMGERVGGTLVVLDETH